LIISSIILVEVISSVRTSSNCGGFTYPFRTGRSAAAQALPLARVVAPGIQLRGTRG
jgi:hypothetical protein